VLAGDPARRRRMGLGARRLAEEVFDRDKLAAAYLAVLLRPRSGRNGECKNGRGAGERVRGACDGEGARRWPGEPPGRPRSGRNGECKNGRGAGEGAHE